MLRKLQIVGYLNQTQENLAGGKNLQNVNVLIAAFCSSLAIAVVLTPFDFIFFKYIAKTHGISRNASFMQVAKATYSRNRPGYAEALAITMAASFFRYFFFLTILGTYRNIN